MCLSLLLCSLAGAREASRIAPAFSRIGNCHAAGLGWRTWEQGADFVETVTVQPDARFSLRFDCVAATAPNVRVSRHLFAFPTRLYAGAAAQGAGELVSLPTTLGADQLLPATRHFVLAGRERTIQTAPGPLASCAQML